MLSKKTQATEPEMFIAGFRFEYTERQKRHEGQKLRIIVLPEHEHMIKMFEAKVCVKIHEDSDEVQHTDSDGVPF